MCRGERPFQCRIDVDLRCKARGAHRELPSAETNLQRSSDPSAERPTQPLALYDALVSNYDNAGGKWIWTYQLA